MHSAWIQMVHDLAHDIEDCIDLFTHHVTLKSDAPWFRQKLHRVKTVNAHNKFAKAICRLRKTSKEASTLRKKVQPRGMQAENKLRQQQWWRWRIHHLGIRVTIR